MLHPDQIPIELFKSKRLMGPQSSLAVETLLNIGLIAKDDDAFHHPTVRMHRLIQQNLRDRVATTYEDWWDNVALLVEELFMCSRKSRKTEDYNWQL